MYFRPFIRKGTYKLNKPKSKSNTELANLAKNDKKLSGESKNDADLDKKLRDLSINIK